MAEGGKQQRSFKDTFSKASDDANEVFCDPCKSEGNSIAVEGYCQICKEYLCENCLRVHRKQTISRAHVILDTEQIPRRHGSLSNRDLCVEVCKTHHPEIIRFYCKDHDIPGCGDCMTLKHTSCKKDRVQDISDGFQKTNEFEDIDQKLQQLHQELKEMEDVLDTSLKNPDTTYNNILLKITSVRKQINEYLDQMQKKITDEAAQMKKEDETNLQTLHAEHQAMKTEIKAMLQILHDSNTNVNSLFVITKQAKQRLLTLKMDVNKIKQQQKRYEFLISTEIENIFSTTPPLGKFKRKSKPDQRASRKPTIYTEAAHSKRVNVKRRGEKRYKPRIKDMTLLSPDRLVVVDKLMVRLIDISNNKVISEYVAPSELDKVASLSTSVIAVTLPLECKMQLLDVTASFSLEREMEISNICNGIAYKDGKLAVSYTNLDGVEILDMQGKILHTIQIQKGLNYSPQHLYYITFGHDDDTVIVSESWNNRVIVVTFNGDILRTYTHNALLDPHGMVITPDGILFVCSWENGCIHVVSPDFKSSKIIINKQNNVIGPTSIAYCDVNHRLYISNTDAPGELDNRIQVYDLNV